MYKMCDNTYVHVRVCMIDITPCYNSLCTVYVLR